MSSDAWLPCLACLVLLAVSAARAAAGPYLAMCVIIKNENRNIREWVEYHQSIGAEKFYIFDHNSTRPAIKEVHDFVDAGLVEYHYFDDFVSTRSGWPQEYVYDKCLQDHGPKHRFMGFLDPDEFVILKAAQRSLPQFLTAFEEFGAVAINWVLFGSSGHHKRPKKGVLESYTKCQPLMHPVHNHVKLIVNTQFAQHLGATPHDFVFSDGKFAVTENFERVDGPFSATISMSKVAIYHYVLKSEEDFALKMGRGSAHGVILKDWDYFRAVDAMATEDCLDAMHLYSPRPHHTNLAAV